MSRKHYIAFARTFSEQVDKLACKETNPTHGLLRSLANSQADVFAADNSRFDRQRFLTACGF